MDAEQNQVLDTASETGEQQETGSGDCPQSQLDSPIEPAESPVTRQEMEHLQDVVTESGRSEEMQETAPKAEKSPKKLVVSPEKVPETSTEVVTKAATYPGKQPELESSTEVSEPATAMYVERENIQTAEPKKQPMPEKTPEPLAENNIETAPEKMAEPVPEAVKLSEQAAPKPVTQPESEDVKLLEPEEKEPEQSEKQAESCIVLEVAPEMPAKPETVKEVEADKQTEAEIVPEPEPKKPVAAETVKKVEAEKPVAAETVKKVEAEKPVAAETVKNEKLVEAEMVKEVESEKQAGGDAVERQKAEVDVQVPAPGTLSFAFLEHEQTKATLRTSRTLIILRGLPGSGKSLLARAIADSYQGLCTVCCADDHGVKPESPEASADGYKAFDDAVVACCSVGTSAQVIVVDDTNHTHDRLARLGEVAEQHRLVAMFLEPRTEWSRDLPQLAKRTLRGLEEAQIQAMKVPLEETSLPLFFGWFLLPGIQDKVRCTSMDFLKTLDTLEAFKKHLPDFTVEAEKEVDLEQYFQANGALHCTTKFCDYGKAEGAKEYADKSAVKELYGSAFELSLSALFVTPRTVGARVSLSEDQLTLWPADAEKEAVPLVPAAATLPAGSRAHITLGCAEGVEAKQTGFDLLEILALQQEGQEGELVEEMELGSLAYYGKGRWLLSLREPVSAQACFSSLYGPKKADATKKDGDKKKKQKCTIL
ncbi:2',3'-cyclic-nucleotide 3'-phosphodiesterase isoform X1 [Salmo salar]|uniref:2',3'-cyclic-nucleotide 3'-phosphodiesterase n=1 Tax=Salmo salar TaxID=8030 RepID=A0A1S3R918_SALSA|nr:2',3'-cyclic-nucleotide 3'-phosphodiesterase isoform X1 [Salmo salar]XP_014048338.2 2',3'-cyclic-nucleotide 3'-phosphodiesterase isoform X1 [Salmo salar]XP_014048339.2 2',3'-cyclic-nucleotide 3'-phosphodiesterase isoform X1 [Salmo salar]